jgi:hypothetical protein
MTDNTDLRNDNAGGALEQAENIILRYLETLPSDDYVSFSEMVEDITRHFPFVGESDQQFQVALEALEKEGLVTTMGDLHQINKTAHVAHKWLRQAVQRSR